MVTTAEQDLFTIAEAAAFVGTDEARVRFWIGEGVLPAIRIGPRQLRIRRNDLVTITNSAETLVEAADQSSAEYISAMTSHERQLLLDAANRASELHAAQRQQRIGGETTSSWILLHEAREHRDRSVS